MGTHRFFSGCSLHTRYHYGCDSCLIATVALIAGVLDEKFPEETLPIVVLDPDRTPK